MKSSSILADEPTAQISKKVRKAGKLGPRMDQKALIRAFISELKPDLAEGICMFRPSTLKDAIGLARMREE